MPWMKNQPWNEGKTDADMAPEVEWNLWQRRQQPFADLEEGSRLYLVVPDGADSIIRLESEVAHVLKYQYTSKDDAWKALRADFPILDDFPFTKKQFLNGYAGDAPDQGWLLAWSQVLIRKIGVVRPRELKFRPNGWLHIDDDQVRQYGLNRGRRLEPPPDPTRPPRAIDPLKRKAVEDRAMDVAHDELVALGCDPVTIENTSANKPYDYTCTRDGTPIRVEVKGLSGPLSAVTPDPQRGRPRPLRRARHDPRRRPRHQPDPDREGRLEGEWRDSDRVGPVGRRRWASDRGGV